jgi:hypothetical protein
MFRISTGAYAPRLEEFGALNEFWRTLVVVLNTVRHRDQHRTSKGVADLKSSAAPGYKYMFWSR